MWLMRSMAMIMPSRKASTIEMEQSSKVIFSPESSQSRYLPEVTTDQSKW